MLLCLFCIDPLHGVNNIIFTLHHGSKHPYHSQFDRRGILKEKLTTLRTQKSQSAVTFSPSDRLRSFRSSTAPVEPKMAFFTVSLTLARMASLITNLSPLCRFIVDMTLFARPHCTLTCTMTPGTDPCTSLCIVTLYI